ncbi:hypothetical protein BBF96_09535 [Anoxybacter fermentans]|uniref:Uncharacterized protein n=1 Tax=Anoxybacter fermentans TaxID=1323375 RepID=A0A3Q9HQR1_9FIRM|nr:hypothetical protein [Anoxybacter fermentans]AZR73608.1 hypothetical protein BBF96_09535 [Anoxybacter fermentans]
MSFIVTLYVPEGIVMAADSRLTMNFQKKLPDGTSLFQSFIASDTNQKLYLINERFGLSLCGEAAINNIPLAGFINTFEERISSNTDVTEIPEALIKYFKEIGNNPRITFHLSGYRVEEGISIPYVYIGHVSESKFLRVNYRNDQIYYGCSWGGDSDIFARLILPARVKKNRGEWKELPYYEIPYNFFTLQDAIDFAIYAIRTTIQTIRFQTRPKTVGGPIDVLVLKPGEQPYWIQKKNYHGENALKEISTRL